MSDIIHHSSTGVVRTLQWRQRNCMPYEKLPVLHLQTRAVGSLPRQTVIFMLQGGSMFRGIVCSGTPKGRVQVLVDGHYLIVDKTKIVFIDEQRA